jgi:hypothetical protein
MINAYVVGLIVIDVAPDPGPRVAQGPKCPGQHIRVDKHGYSRRLTSLYPSFECTPRTLPEKPP